MLQATLKNGLARTAAIAGSAALAALAAMALAAAPAAAAFAPCAPNEPPPHLLASVPGAVFEGAIVDPQGHLYATDLITGRVYRFNHPGAAPTVLTTVPGGVGAGALAFEPDGSLLIGYGSDPRVLAGDVLRTGQDRAHQPDHRHDHAGRLGAVGRRWPRGRRRRYDLCHQRLRDARRPDQPDRDR